MSIRRLVICFDGTWNTPDSGSKPTNVVKLLRAVKSRDRDVSQVVFYDKGVGTGGIFDRIVGGASGAGLTSNVIDGYRFLGNNFDGNDEIYIFGFSRGAYTARSLAGLIGLAGILKPTHLGGALLRVIDIYRDATLSRQQKLDAISALNVDRHVGTTVKCVGVWDTVGSLGVPGDLGRRIYLKSLLFHDVQLSSCVDIALHAVAIDEKRGPFAPTLWVSRNGKPAHDRQIVEQVWFSGVHSNVGGSYDDAGLSDIAFDWMVKRIETLTDLTLDRDYLESHCDPNIEGTGYESRTTMYISSRPYPYQRLIGQNIPQGMGLGAWFRKTFKSWDRRNIVPKDTCTINEFLHISTLERWNCAEVLYDAKNRHSAKRRYRPSNLEAAIRLRTLPVVGWDGRVIKENSTVPKHS